VEIHALGNRLRSRRTATGRTIASVAAEAGLSVPYIANLENGRGNPTLSAISSLATALGARLVVELAEVDNETRSAPVVLPDTLMQFSRSPRFTTEAARLARVTPAAETVTRERLLHAMAGMGSLAGRPLRELDWHRILDVVILITRNS
jgi:transcriptional regulator with XRE-family HTH domain